MTDYVRLDWDSRFFGSAVARIVPDRLSSERLAALLEELRGQGVSLVYWATACEPPDVAATVSAFAGRLVDRRVTYVRNLDAGTAGEERAAVAVETYASPDADEDLERLAVQAGEFSRFRVDPGISRDKFEELYRIWIRKSVTKDLADAVLVIRGADRRVVAMITVGEKQGRGDIGLVAVDDSSRGRGLGKHLLAAAMRYFRERDLELLQVVTQGANRAACRLYESVGCSVEEQRDVYHFWLA